MKTIIYEFYNNLDAGQILGLVFTIQIAFITIINILVYGASGIYQNYKTK